MIMAPIKFPPAQFDLQTHINKLGVLEKQEMIKTTLISLNLFKVTENLLGAGIRAVDNMKGIMIQWN